MTSGSFSNHPVLSRRMMLSVAAAALAVAILPLSTRRLAALDLDGARKAGLVGERTDGYIGTVGDAPSEEARQLVKSINSRRRAAYQEIATKNATSLEAVEALMGKKLIGKAASGTWVMDAVGGWMRKP